MSDFTEPEHNINVDAPADGFDASFLEQSAKEQGYDETKEPGARVGPPPPEGAYLFRWERKHSDEADAINDRTGLPTCWKPGVTKPKKAGAVASSFIGTSLQGSMLRPAPGSHLTVDEFDQLNLANRMFYHYVSNLVRFGRMSLTDWLNSVLPEKVNPGASVKELILMVEELLPQVPESVATVRWTLQWKDESEEDTRKQFKPLYELDKKLNEKFSKGPAQSKAWPKDEDGSAKTSFTWNLTQGHEAGEGDAADDETVVLFVRAEIDACLPYKPVED